MGQKVHPESMRVGYIHDWKSNWFNEKHFSDYLYEDIQIRNYIQGRLAHAVRHHRVVERGRDQERGRSVVAS